MVRVVEVQAVSAASPRGCEAATSSFNLAITGSSRPTICSGRSRAAIGAEVEIRVLRAGEPTRLSARPTELPDA